MSPEVGAGAGEAALQLPISKALKWLTISTIEAYDRLLWANKEVGVDATFEE
jgi:hypothetical protein